MNVGPPRLDIVPLRPDGNLGANVRGNHRGPAAGLNIHNPQPGMHYYHCRHPQADRRGAQYRRYVNSGWRPIAPSDPEYTQESDDLDLKGLGISDFHIKSDVIAMKIPEERYRAQQAFAQATRDAQIEGPTAEYLNQARELEGSYGARADGPLYFKRPGHGNNSQ